MTFVPLTSKNSASVFLQFGSLLYPIMQYCVYSLHAFHLLDCTFCFSCLYFSSYLLYTFSSFCPYMLYSVHTVHHGRKIYKDTKPYMSAFLSVNLLTEFAAFCLTDFIDWRYIHSWFVISTQLVNCCPHGRRNDMVLVYCCPSIVPSL
jgi:hypothetical protein